MYLSVVKILGLCQCMLLQVCTFFYRISRRWVAAERLFKINPVVFNQPNKNVNIVPFSGRLVQPNPESIF